ncbi:roadblock/LC7 domain-containing protein [Demequina sediminicola]|uniref:roadblock/LC7 domain-containing protein n=1 Tax=Demequina sediminicola TaxID=1095026 RepID=UPI000785FA9C|nr:roadblock/LC7 domain-containing protein [Demequina sediminicola]
MIVAKHGMLVAARVKQALPGVERVIVARTDGIALYDDVPLAARDGAAAVTAATVGLAATATASFGMGAARLAVIHGESGALAMAPIDSGHLLAVVVDADSGYSDDQIARVVRAEAEWLRSFSGMATQGV